MVSLVSMFMQFTVVVFYKCYKIGRKQIMEYFICLGVYHECRIRHR